LIPDLPQKVEVTMREAEGRKLLFVLNTAADPSTVSGVPSGVDLLTGRPVNGALRLGSYGCSVIKLAE
jgi:beta-galactosidase